MDEQGFTEWAVGRQRQLLRSAYLLTGDLHRAEDLVQEALTKVALRWSRLADGNPTAGAAVLAVLLGGGTAWAVQDRVPRADTVDTPVPTPTPTAVETDEGGMGTQPLWNPFTVVDAPRSSTVLPEVLAPPVEAPSVLDAPIPAAVLAWPEEDRPIMLLSPEGEWRSIPDTESIGPSTLVDVAVPALSRDGRLVSFAAQEGLRVVDVVAGEQRLLPWPDEIAGPWDTPPGVRWMPGDDAVLVMHWNTPWVMGLDGSDESAAYLGGYLAGVAVDPDGPLLQRQFRSGRLVEWRDGEVVRRTDDGIAWGERMVAGHGMVALTGGLGGGALAGPIVIDATSGERVAYAPIRDVNSEYSDNGYLTVQGFLDPDTALLLVGPIRFGRMEQGEERWHLVVWRFRSGDFELLSSGDTRMRGIEVAVDLVDDGVS